MKLVDCHCHLLDSRLAKDLDGVVDRAKKAGVEFVIHSGIGGKSNRDALELSKKYEGFIKCSFGIYPVDAALSQIEVEVTDDVRRYLEKFDIDEELEWIEDNKDSCVAIGEAGLDYKVIPGTEEIQKKNFEKVIKLCLKLDLPLITHSRKGEADVISMLEERGVKKVMMHCFSGRKSLIKKCVENGWYLSVPSVITRLEHFKMLVEIVPLDLLLTETDAPYLTSEVGRLSEPADVRITIGEIAKIKKVSEEEVAEKIRENARKLFGV